MKITLYICANMCTNMLFKIQVPSEISTTMHDGTETRSTGKDYCEEVLMLSKNACDELG